ncbi:MAG: transcription-repair coupling factor, partial [Bacteroidaceae bacterium]|nr:transcription-repair coupling factor [Bacteroidaceae bacterium]
MLIDNSQKKITISGLHASSAPLVFSAVGLALPEAFSMPFLFIMDDEEQAGYFYNDLNQILNGGNAENGRHADSICFLPSSFRRAVKYGQRDAASEILRTDALTRLSTGKTPLFIVTYPSAMSELAVSRQQLETNTLSLSKGQNIDIKDVQNKLFDLGFQRTDYVYEPGQFAVRGSLVDVYSFSCEHPYRIDFFGDEIDSLRTFDVENQLSIDKLSEIQIVPELTTSTEQCVPILSFLPQDTIIVTRDMVFLSQEIQRIWNEGFGMSAEISAAEEDKQLDKQQTLCNPDIFNHHITNFKTVLLGYDNITDIELYTNIKPNLQFNISPQPVFHKNFDLLTTELKHLQEEKYKIYILADSQKQTDRLESIFRDIGAGIHFTPVTRTLHAGFIDQDCKTVIFTDHQIFDRFHKYNLRSEKARRGKMALTLKEIQQFQLGDYVVHIDHGVGRFGGLISIPEGGQMVEKIRINYDGGGVIYVSIHSLHKISKYKGQEGTAPRINRLGTGAWERLKERTKTKIKDIARDLIKLYSRRRTQKGYSFSPDTYLQAELEASFLYEDTPDQFRATQDVKNDMQKARPMDRLVCGDVGFGKTEVAIRAAFKAATDGKQVAVLVPTTVLAYQH